MEMEPMVVSETNGDSQQHEESSSSPGREPLNPVLFVVNLWALVVVYATYYRSITAPVGALLVIIFVTLSLEHIAKVSAGHHKISITHDYATVLGSDLKLSNVDHWCLQVRCMFMEHIGSLNVPIRDVSVLDCSNAVFLVLGSRATMIRAHATMCQRGFRTSKCRVGLKPSRQTQNWLANLTPSMWCLLETVLSKRGMIVV